MRILLDHGSLNNLGDRAMLEAVAQRLLHLGDRVCLHVRDRPGLKTELWQCDRVIPTTLEVPDPLRTAPSLSQVPYLWRYEEHWRTLWRKGCYALLDRLLDPCRLPLGDDPGGRTLGTLCANYDLLHLVGGGYLAEAFADELWQKCCLVHAFAAQGKPVLLTGQQLGPCTSRWARLLLQKALRKVAFVGLREPTESLTFCAQASLSPGRYTVMGDDSFGLEPADAAAVRQVLSRYQLTPGRFLAVNLRLGDYVSSHRQYVNSFAQLISSLAMRYELPVVVVPISLNDDDSDIVSGYQLQQAVGGEILQVLDDAELSPRLVKGILGQAHAALGVSYHFCTFALTQGVPALCVFDGAYYAQKAHGLARFWGEERLLLPLRDCGSAAAFQQVTSLIDDTSFRETLQGRAQEAVRNWEEVFERVVHTVLQPERSWAR